MSINKCKIGGIVAEVPKRMNSLFYGDVLEIRLDINRKDIDKIEHVTCLIVDKELIERAMNTIGVGDYLFCFGHFVSLEYKRKQLVKCPHCGKEGYRMRKAQHTDIILRDFEVTKGIDLSDSDGVNRVVLTGVGKNPIQQREGHNRFQIVNNRPIQAQQHLMEIVTEELLAGSERFNLVNVNTFNGLATHVSKTVKQSNRVIVKGSIYDRMIKYTIPCKCKYCGEMSEYGVVYPQYEVTATSVRQDVDYISKS